MVRKVSKGFWVRDVLLVLGVSVLAPAVAMVTLVYWALVGWLPLLAILGVFVGKSQHRAAGLTARRARWLWFTPLTLLAGTAVGAAAALRLADAPGNWGPELALVPICAVAAVLAGHAWLLRREPAEPGV
jgi:hypothetical protein